MKQIVYILPIILLFTANYSFTQSKHTNHWYFGNNAGLDFSSGAPVAVGNSGMNTWEGSTSYSDENGNLLFYSNGVGVSNDIAAVWNSNHQIMPNGILTDSTGNATSMQSSIVVPMPGSSVQYYLFTLDGYESYYSPDYKGVTYSIIDMSLDGGLGDVIDKASPLSAPAVPFLSEQMTATRHANGTDYWLIIHESNHINYNSNKFIIYQISSSGISSPLIQFIGMDDSPGMQSTMQVSSQGDKIAFNWEIFDFDNATGVLSNPILLGGSWGYREFSRNGRFLYVSQLTSGLYQFDLNATNIPASQYQLSSYSEFGQIQIGLDDKIYVAMQQGAGQPYLSVINAPNQPGALCDFSMNALNLVNGLSTIGLPNFIDFVPKDQTSLSENDQLTDIRLSPNPATSNLMVNYNSADLSLITLTDIQGKVVMDKTKVHSGNSIDLSHLQSGNYLVKIELNGQVYWKKLMVE